MRPATLRDLEPLAAFAMRASIGFTNLPKNKEVMKKKIEASEGAFRKQVLHPENELYLFVLEDENTNELGGTCCIFSKTGQTTPKYFYVLDKENSDRALPILRAESITQGPSEIGGLYLVPEFREKGLGRLLSLSRFLFMASFPHRFEKETITEIRGVILEDKTSPFWDSTGLLFTGISFAQAQENLLSNPSYPKTVLPKYPIYTSLIAKKGQEAILQAHCNSIPAKKMLEEEGFRENGSLDVFDGGPHLQAKTDEIRAIRESRELVVGTITDTPIIASKCLISNEKMDFRVCQATLEIDEKGFAILNDAVARALHVHLGDLIRTCALSPREER